MCIRDRTESIHAACPGIGFDYDMANLWHEPDEDIRSLKSFRCV